ncbi:MAG: ATP-binding cassette domain-containing protein, partial [Chloroflexota bacterium]
MMPTAPERQPIFDLQAVHHTYPGPKPVTALQGIDLRIDPGEYVAIIGANGSGKSTLARHLNGLLLPSQGQVRVGGLDTREAGRLGAVRRLVQMVFQQPDLQIVATTVDEDTAFGAENFGVPDAELPERVAEALQAVGMWQQRSRPPHMLSAGQKQRVAIAGALAVRPQALVLDEATSMLDPAGRAAVLEVLRQQHARGITLVTITHEMEEAAEATRLVVLDHGRVALDGAPRDIFAHPVELRRLGLDIPPLVDLSLRLGLPLCLTAGELLAALGAPPAVAQAAPAAPAGEPSGAPALIRVQDLRHAYLSGTPLEAVSLRGISLEIARGTITGLIGQTGSGKST